MSSGINVKKSIYFWASYGLILGTTSKSLAEFFIYISSKKDSGFCIFGFHADVIGIKLYIGSFIGMHSAMMMILMMILY